MDGGGDAYVAGQGLADGEDTFLVVRIDGTTGAEVWRYEVSGFSAEALDVVLDASGDVLAAGRTFVVGNGFDFAVARIDGDTGAELWRSEIDTAQRRDVARDVAIDAAGDVFAAGSFENGPLDSDFGVVKLDGATGAVVWQREIDVGGSASADFATSIAVGPAGDPVAGGILDGDLAIIKFEGATGASVWNQTPNGGGPTVDGLDTIAIDSTGDVYAGGQLTRSMAERRSLVATGPTRVSYSRPPATSRPQGRSAAKRMRELTTPTLRCSTPTMAAPGASRGGRS